MTLTGGGGGGEETLVLVSLYFFRKNWGLPGSAVPAMFMFYCQLTQHTRTFNDIFT